MSVSSRVIMSDEGHEHRIFGISILVSRLQLRESNNFLKRGSYEILFNATHALIFNRKFWW